MPFNAYQILKLSQGAKTLFLDFSGWFGHDRIPIARFSAGFSLGGTWNACSSSKDRSLFRPLFL
jgi:hypothetical protein